ncbi:reverse transcriptase (rna-dependent dna polymerase) [Holotrichia oblita]|uniref:Reverse transcriptase (Rna-dependent dna polymerase) n=1 Tax=Holotrichia oblita TaxID=644536 RepID=A0ACB9SKE3_HOLOL|nr:reverse transcriptase (rna-dependent dna polymerase) [Holotrichia oblita]
MTFVGVEFSPEDGGGVAIKKVFTYLSYLKEQNTQILKLLQNQQNTSVPPSPYLLPEDLPINISLNNKESVDIFEQYLSDNRKAEILCIYFSTLGGRNDITSKTNVILRNIMTDFLAAQYSFHGSRNGKNSFVELNLHTVILRMYLLIFILVVFILVVIAGAVQTSLPNSTQHEIDTNIKSWLKHAPQRLKFKQAKKTNKNNSDHY